MVDWRPVSRYETRIRVVGVGPGAIVYYNDKPSKRSPTPVPVPAPARVPIHVPSPAPSPNPAPPPSVDPLVSGAGFHLRRFPLAGGLAVAGGLACATDVGCSFGGAAVAGGLAVLAGG